MLKKPLRRKKNLIQSSRMSKKKDKKNKGVVSKARKPTGDIKKDKGTCHHCGNEGHWRMNCNEYLTTMKTISLMKLLLQICL